MLCGYKAIFRISARRMRRTCRSPPCRSVIVVGVSAPRTPAAMPVPARSTTYRLVVLGNRSAREQDVGQQAHRRTMPHRGEVRTEIAAGGVAEPMTRGARA